MIIIVDLLKGTMRTCRLLLLLGLLGGTTRGVTSFSLQSPVGMSSRKMPSISQPRLCNRLGSQPGNGNRLGSRLRMQDLAAPPAIAESAADDAALTRERFDFTKQWYPLAVLEFLAENAPHPIQLLGKDLVMWKDRISGKWNVFEDACPHRLAPLSEGRVEADGTLLCAYHAWRFG